MGSGGSSSSQTSTEPWKKQQPFLEELYRQAQGLFEQGNYEYGPDRVTGFANESLQAFGQVQARGGPGGTTALTRGAEAEAGRTLSGEYLDPESNPWLTGVYNTGAREINRNYRNTINSLGSRMESAGRTGSGAHAVGTQVAGENLATGLGDFASQLFGGAYEAERGRMGAMAAAAPSINEMGWRDISALRSVGQQREEQSQRELDDFIARFQQQQYGSAEKLAEFSTMLGSPVQTSRGKSESINVGILS